MTSRIRQRRKWLEDQFGEAQFDIRAVSGDASFRSYYRLLCHASPRRDTHGRASYILMDAPPEQENCQPFIAITAKLCSAGLNVPQIIAADTAQGFLLLSDLGEYDYLQRLNAQRADALYGDAIAALVQMQTGIDDTDLAPYSAEVLNREMHLFSDWFLKRHLQLKPDTALAKTLTKDLDDAMTFLTLACLEQPQVFVHRDYHSRNLMQCADFNPGILDYQDAVFGPIGYDLVSLLRDVYICWPEQRVQAWIDRYHEHATQAGLLATSDRSRLQRWFDLCGIQRHMKVAGIFSRLYYRDKKHRYLADLPLTLKYLLDVAGRYPELSSLCHALNALDILNTSAQASAWALAEQT